MRRAALLVVAVLLPAPALAQSDAASASARANDERVRLGDAIDPEHAAGDWNGIRTRWSDAGVGVQLGYLAEIADVADGGLRQGLDYAHQVKLQVDLDGKALVGVDGLGFHAALINREGRSASADYLNDDLFQVQEIYGGVGGADLHLSFAYGEYVLADGKAGLKAGRMSVGQDFATSPLYCQFLSLGLCPQPRALSLGRGFSIVPSATWGGRAQVKPGAIYVSLGAYQVRPRYGGPSGFDWGFSDTTGVIVPAEIGWEPRFGAHALQGHYKAGLTVDTSNYPDLRPGARGHDARWSWWLLADQMLVRTGKAGTDGLMLLGGWSHDDSDTAILSDFAFAGVVARGMIEARPGDSVQLLVGHADVSDKLTAAQRAAQVEGRELPTGFPAAPGGFAAAATAPGVQTSHRFVEAGYGLKIRPGITLVPDVQYLWRPAASRAVPDALVLAARVEVNL